MLEQNFLMNASQERRASCLDLYNSVLIGNQPTYNKLDDAQNVLRHEHPRSTTSKMLDVWQALRIFIVGQGLKNIQRHFLAMIVRKFAVNFPRDL